jgi:hypothetical protein
MRRKSAGRKGPPSQIREAALLYWIYGLIITAGVLFLTGTVARFVRHHEATVWWRGAMGLLAFAHILLMLQIYFLLSSGSGTP